MRLFAATLISFICASAVCAHQFRYEAPLTGLDESPANASLALGSALVTLDEDLLTLRVEVTFRNLLGTVTGANIRGVTATPLSGTAIVAVPLTSFPTQGTSGSYDATFDLADPNNYNPTFIQDNGPLFSDALNSLIFGLNDGKTYLDVDSSAIPNGEIRGFLVYLLGDFNNNGVVDAADYTIWRNSLGQRDDGLFADSNNDFVVDELDYDAWQENFGHTRSFVGGGASGATVPEPSTIALIGAACVTLLIRRRC